MSTPRLSVPCQAAPHVLLVALAFLATGAVSLAHDCPPDLTPVTATFTNGSGNNLWTHNERIDDANDPSDIPSPPNWTSRAFPNHGNIIFNPNEPGDHKHPIPACNPIYHAVINSGASPLLASGVTVESVAISSGGGLQLSSTSNVSGTLNMRGAGLTNHGAITLNNFAPGTTPNSQAFISFDGGSGVHQIDGSGSIELRGGANSQGAHISLAEGIRPGGPGEWVVTHGANHTIFGSGHVIAGSPFAHAIAGRFINNGTLLGNAPGASLALVLNFTQNQNNGSFIARNGGGFYFEGTMVQSGTGEFLADAGTVQLGGGREAIVSGGKLRTQNGGKIVSQWSQWSGLVNTGIAEVPGSNNNAGRLRAFGGGFTNDGTITINPNAPTTGEASLLFSENATIGGTGTLVLNGAPAARAQWSIGGNATTTNGAGHTIRGRGIITTFGEFGGRFVNNGIVNADSAPDNLHLALRGEAGSVNNNLIKASNGGVLSIGGRLDQGANGQLFADGGNLVFGGLAILGGALASANGGKVLAGGNNTFGSLVNSAQVEIGGSSFGRLFVSGGGFTNNGTIVVNPTNSANQALLSFGENATISGNGAIVLNGEPEGNAVWLIGGGATTVNGAGHTIRGRGVISTFGEFGGRFRNDGIVNADHAPDNIHLALRNQVDSVNNGVLKASNGGILSMGGRLDQTANGQMFADGGNIFVSGTIAGGKLASANGGFIQGQDLFLQGEITNNGDLRLSSGYGPMRIETGTFVNNGTITNAAAGNNELWFTAPTTMTGAGALVLRSGSVTDLLGNTVTNGAGHTVKGTGTIRNGSFINNGIVAPGESPGTLVFNGNFTQGANGAMNIEIGGNTAGTGYDQVVVNGTATLNGTLNITLINGYKPTVGDVFTILSPSAVSGSFSQINSPGLEVQANYASGAMTVTVTKIAPTITSATTASGTQGEPFSYQITAIDQPTSFGATGLPAGLSVASATGLISGTPSEAGTFSVTLSASNSAGTDTEQLTLTIGPGATPTPTPTATPTATPTPTPTASPTPNTTLLNISTRLRVGVGENALIGGFIITGTQPKKVIIRAIGPSLARQDVAGALQDTTLQLFDGTGEPTAFSDNWKDDQRSEIEATTIPPSNDLESAIVRTLEPGNYTAVVRGKNDSTGIGLVEVYDVSSGALAKLANISSRGFVETGENVLIGGFIVSGGGADTRVVIRALGPSLGGEGVLGVLQNPALELVDANGTTVRENDNWKDSQQADLEALQIAPTNDLESALIANVTGGNYTAIVRGNNDGTGVGLVEVYNVN
jgi:hypothetical protein